MNELVKRAANDAYKSFEEKKDEQQKQLVKEIVQRTLEKIDILDKEIKEREEKRKALKLDIDDLRNGRLDLVLERQQKDSVAKQVSVITIREVVREKFIPFWNQPYIVDWNPPAPKFGDIWCGVSSTQLSDGSIITASVAKDNTTGAYNVHGRTINLR